MWQLTTCFKSSKLTQIGPYMLMSLSVLTSSMVRHGTCDTSTQWREDWSSAFVVTHYCKQPYYLTTRFLSPSSHMVSAQLFPDRPRPTSCKSAQMGFCPITFLWLWPATDHGPHSWHMPTNKIWRRTEASPQSRWWCSHMAGINSDYSTRRMTINYNQ